MNKIEWNKVTSLSKLLALIFFLLVVPVLTFYIGVQYQQTVDVLELANTPVTLHIKNQVAQAPQMQSYKSAKYNVEFSFPMDWNVTEATLQDGMTPVINIYKKTETQTPPFTHHTPVTQVSIFPKGIPTEGMPGVSRKSSVQFAEKILDAQDYILTNGKSWATFATFTNVPASWEYYGFVWARAAVSNFTQTCMVEEAEVDIDRCLQLPMEGELMTKGEVNAKERATEEQIMASITFSK